MEKAVCGIDPWYQLVIGGVVSTMYREQGNTAEAFERTDIDQDTAPRDISICVQGRYPGSQDLTYHLPMNWSIHSGIKSSLKKSPGLAA